MINIGVNHGRWGGYIPQIYGGGWLYHHPANTQMLTGQPSGTQYNQIAPAYSEPIGLGTVVSTSSSACDMTYIVSGGALNSTHSLSTSSRFSSISKISISLGAGFVH